MNRMRPLARSWIPLLVLVASACGGDGSPTEPEDVTFDASLGVNLAQMTRLASGVYIQTVTPGTGTRQVLISDWMAAHYKFWIPNGTLIQDSSQPGQQPYNGYVTSSIEGFALGVLGMKVGEVRLIVIPSALAYGSEPPSTNIPKNSVLIYLVTLASIG